MMNRSKILCLLALMTIDSIATPIIYKKVPIADTLTYPCTGSTFGGGDMTGKIDMVLITYRKVLTT
jgi:hypothetical protein